MLKKVCLIGCILFCLIKFNNSNALAFGQESIVINEVAWMGGLVSANDEWLELYNPSLTEIDLTGWNFSSASGTPNITLKGVVPASGYFLLERTDDNSALGVLAQQIYSGALSCLLYTSPSPRD